MPDSHTHPLFKVCLCCRSCAGGKALGQRPRGGKRRPRLGGAGGGAAHRVRSHNPARLRARVCTCCNVYISVAGSHHKAVKPPLSKCRVGAGGGAPDCVRSHHPARLRAQMRAFSSATASQLRAPLSSRQSGAGGGAVHSPSSSCLFITQFASALGHASFRGSVSSGLRGVGTSARLSAASCAPASGLQRPQHATLTPALMRSVQGSASPQFPFI